MYKLINNPYFTPHFEADKGGSGADDDIQGDANVTDENMPEEDDADDADDEKKKEAKNKTFTQSQLNRMMTKEKNQGKNSVYKDLGIDPNDKKSVAMFKAFVESQKTEEQKKVEKNVEEQSKTAEIEKRAIIAEAKVEAMRLGVQPKFVDDVIVLAMAKISENEELKDVIGEFKKKYPSWFEISDDSEESKKSTGKKGTGSNIKNKITSGKKNDDENSLGARLAAKRKAQAKQSLYWSKK